MAYTEGKAESICNLIASGNTLVSICEMDEYPSYATVCVWLNEHPEFQENYTRARQTQADYFADQIISISDTEIDPQRAKVRIDARKWHASKTAPKKYSDRIEQVHSGTLTLEQLVTGSTSE